MLEYGLTPKFWLADVLLATHAGIELGGDVRIKKISNRFQTLGKVAILGVMNIKVRIFR